MLKSLSGAPSPQALRRFSLVITLLVACLAVIKLLGWYFDYEPLTRPIRDIPPLVPTTALILLIYSGVLLAQAWMKYRYIAYLLRLLIVGVIVLGALMLTGYVYPESHVYLGALLNPSGISFLAPGVSSPQTAVITILFGLALLCSTTAKRCFSNFSEWLMLIVLILLVGILFGYAQQEHVFYSYQQGIGISLITATAFALLVWVFLLSSGCGFLFAVLNRESYGGELMRWVMLLSVWFPLVVAWLSCFIGNEFLTQVQMQVVIASVVFSFIVLLARYLALRLDAQEQQRQRADDEIRTLQYNLLHMNRVSTMSEMTTGIAHEINQPLTAIKNFVAVGHNLSKSAETQIDPRFTGVIDNIDAQVMRIAAIIRSIRQLVQKRPPARKQVDIRHLVNDLMALISIESQQENIAVRVDIADDLPDVCIDEVQIQQCLLNLLRNAIEAMKETPPAERMIDVRIAVSEQQSQQTSQTLSVEVSDRGHGIPKEKIDGIFDYFVSGKDEKINMGLGLSLCQSIIRAHDGDIHVTSEPGKGTTFMFTLPLVSVEGDD